MKNVICMYSSLTLPGFYLVISVIYLRATCSLKKKKKELSLKPSSLHSRSFPEILPLVRKFLFIESGILVNIWSALACRQKTWFFFYVARLVLFSEEYMQNQALALYAGNKVNQNGSNNYFKIKCLHHWFKSTRCFGVGEDS